MDDTNLSPDRRRQPGFARVLRRAARRERPAHDTDLEERILLPLPDEIGAHLLAETAALAAEAIGLPRWTDLVAVDSVAPAVASTP